MEYEYGLMTKADKYLVESIYNILQNGIKDENPRPKYEDGTPAHTYFVTHQKVNFQSVLYVQLHGKVQSKRCFGSSKKSQMTSKF